MDKRITSNILVAYSQCQRKAFLLMRTKTHDTPHEYVKILDQQKQNNQRKYLDMLRKKYSSVKTYSQDALKGGSDFLVNASLEKDGLVARCGLLTKAKTHTTPGQYSYEPTIFAGTHGIRKEHKLELSFVGYVLEQIQNKQPIFGKVIGLNQKCYRIKLASSKKTLLPILETLQEWMLDFPVEPPQIILNEHCSTCQFQKLCHAQSEQEDNLSLLDSISTSKSIKKYEKEGIFTVKQLSYTFRPRKHKKRTRNPPKLTHKPELQALAIREKKIYLQELSELTRQPVELFLDVEGIPDQQFYYLIGLLVCRNSATIYYPFWADRLEDEAQMWQEFLNKVTEYADAPIYHYGSYESKFVSTLTNRYDTGENSLKKRLINVNKCVYGKVYFPVYSNGLKEIGKFIGATWTSPNASGLQTLVWRHDWEETLNVRFRNLLVAYNQEDCQALKLLTDELSKIKLSANILSDVDFANQPKQHTSEIGEEIHSQFREMLKFAQGRYDKRKISFRPNQKDNSLTSKNRSFKKGYQGQRKVRPKPTKTVLVPRGTFCPKCANRERLQSVKGLSKRLIIDLVLTKNGIRKTITEYLGEYGYCKKCARRYAPSEVSKYGRTQLYGHGFKAWFVYQRVALRLPYEKIAELIKEQFNEEISWGYSAAFLRDMSHQYAKTEEAIAKRILMSPFIHVDETPLNIRGVNQYVWVFTDGKYRIFKLRESREAKIVQEILKGYKGVLISDFYPGYDSIECIQQKCWVHLIRDLNDDLSNSPFDTEYETFVLEIKNLIIPIMEATQKYGLKKRHLNKFRNKVENFYETVIIDRLYKSETVIKYQKRFIRYRYSLFTFLEQNGIPWNNRAYFKMFVQRHFRSAHVSNGLKPHC